MSGVHSILPPSSMARIVQCPGSVVMEAAYPETGDRPEAAEGEAAHWAASEMLQGRLVDVGQITPAGIVLDQAMVEGADMIYDDVVATLKPHGMSVNSGASEMRVTIPAIHPQCFGTLDYRAWTPATPERYLKLFLWDYKHGFRPVEAFENWQLIAYVLGVMQQATAHDMYVDVEVRIVQPRAQHRLGPIRSWSCRADKLRPYLEIARAACAEALGPAPRTVAGPECRDCRARHACPTFSAAAMDACDVAGQAQPFDLSPAAAGLELRILRQAEERIKARISGIEEQVLAVARRGTPTPHWRVEHGQGRIQWTVPADQVIEMGRMLGVNVAKPVEAITPLQAKAAGLPAQLVDGISKSLNGAAALVLDDGTAARRVFG